MTRYRVPVDNDLLAERPWAEVAGFRLVTVDGPWLRDPGHMTICTFEDDGAPAEMEGLLVEPVITSHADGTATVTGRHLVEAQAAAH